MRKDQVLQKEPYQKVAVHRLTISFCLHLVGTIGTFPMAGTLPAIQLEMLVVGLAKTVPGVTRESSLKEVVADEVGEEWLVLVKVIDGVIFV